MQLILETENTSIDIKEKMAAFDQESLDEKLITNGVKEPIHVPNGNKENIQSKDNIISSEEKLSPNEDKQIVQEDMLAQPTVSDRESKVNIEEIPEKDIKKTAEKDIQETLEKDSEEALEKDIENEGNIAGKTETLTPENVSKDSGVTNTVMTIDESLNDIIQETHEEIGKEHSSCMDSEKENVESGSGDVEEKLSDCIENEVATKDNNFRMDLEITGCNKISEQKSTEILKQSGVDANPLDNKDDNVGMNKKNTGNDVELEVVNKENSEQKSTENLKQEALSGIGDNLLDNIDNDVGIHSKIKENDVRLEIVHDKKLEQKSLEILKQEAVSEIDNVGMDTKIIGNDVELEIVHNKKSQKSTENLKQVSEIDINLLDNKDGPVGIDPKIIGNDAELEIVNDEKSEHKPIEDLKKEAVSGVNLNLSDNNIKKENERDAQKVSLKNEACLLKEDAASPLAITGDVESSEAVSSSDKPNTMAATSDAKMKTNIEDNEVTQYSMDCDAIVPSKSNDVTPMECDKVADVVINENNNDAVISMDCDEVIKEPVENEKVVNAATKEDKVQTIDCDSVTEIKDVALNSNNSGNITETPDVAVALSENNDVSTNAISNDNKVTVETTNEKKDVTAESAGADSKDEVVDLDDIKVIEDLKEKSVKNTEPPGQPEKNVKKVAPTICRLSNTLDILSDDEDEPTKKEESQVNKVTDSADKQCINIEDDDDIMVIDEDKDDKSENKLVNEIRKTDDESKSESNTIKLDDPKDVIIKETIAVTEKDSTVPDAESKDLLEKTEVNEKISDEVEKPETLKPLIPDNFFKTYKKNLADMTREDLEEFCILKIVESVIDRSSLNEIRSKLKTMMQNTEEYKKKAMMLTKQNRDLQVVLKSVQEEQKKGGGTPITPLKITRSVGMQVLMTDKIARRKVLSTPLNAPSSANNANVRPVRNINTNQGPRQQAQANNQQIPVPRLVPASNVTANKNTNVLPQANLKSVGKPASALPNGIRNSPPAQKPAEKRSFNRVQSVTVDLTDDEPPNKIPTRASPAPPVRLVPSQNLLAPRPQLGQHAIQQPVNSPRKVYIPISGPTGTNVSVRPGQTIMLKSVPTAPPRQRPPMGPMVRIPQNSVRMTRVQSRHPAPLPDAMKQYQPPNWKALPPAPDLKLSKVENGIVISWKIDGYQEDSYEEIASYQLYAYQETSSPPSTSLWKKIGDVKALPLPMACTLTQFMAGFKYYFAVRAVDVRSRLGPFSLPGSILLLNKM